MIYSINAFFNLHYVEFFQINPFFVKKRYGMWYDIYMVPYIRLSIVLFDLDINFI